MSNEPTTEERLAALRQRQNQRPPADSPLDPPTPGPQARQTERRRSPATTARYVTVGASTTAVIGLMGAFSGLAANAENSSGQNAASNPPANSPSTADGSQSIAVEADAAVVMVVVDNNGRPVGLRSIDSAEQLAVILASGQPLIDPVAVSTTPMPEPTSSASSIAQVQSAVTQATQTTQVTANPASSQQTPTESSLASGAAQATSTPPPSTAPETTVAAPSTPAPSPETTVPLAQPAPVELKLPTPTPSQGNSSGS